MTDVSALSDADLKAELERRAKASLPDPVPLLQPDFRVLVETVTEGVVLAIADGYQDEDFAYYVYEAAMTAVYGEGYWEWRWAQKW